MIKLQDYMFKKRDLINSTLLSVLYVADFFISKEAAEINVPITLHVTSNEFRTFANYYSHYELNENAEFNVRSDDRIQLLVMERASVARGSKLRTMDSDSRLSSCSYFIPHV